MIQWRLLNGCGEDLFIYWFVFFMFLRDGFLCLWLDMEGFSYLSFCFGDSQELRKKFIFFMVVVVDVNKCLNGILGYDIFVIWVFENRIWGNFEEKRFLMRNNSVKRLDLIFCEWLVGVGFCGKVVLWFIYSLDDILFICFF